ncbi:MAG: ribosome biogenesis GTPase YqeH [Bacilli bacterium]|nr:ribosome biogenesis GTPase YqeH [Bacilli bacterium]
MSKCIGCGIKLQSENKELPGYVPVSSTVEHGENVYCERCYKIIHHNYDYSNITYDMLDNPEKLKELEKTYYQKLEVLKGKKALILLMIDVLDIYSGFIDRLDQYVGNNPVVILANKADVLPKNLKVGNIVNKIKTIGLNDNLNVREVYLISALKQKNIENVMNKIKGFLSHHKGELTDVYVVGSTSVGKSTFINTLLKIYAGSIKDVLTVSSQHQTTQDFIKINIGTNAAGKTCYLIDTPGAINLKNITTYLSKESLKIVNVKNFIKVRNYQLKEKQTLFLGGLVRLDFESEAMSVACYISNDLYVHRTKTDNVERVMETSRFTLLKPPFNEEEETRLGDYVTYEYHLGENDKFASWDIALAGLGYIHLTGKDYVVKVSVPKTMLVTIVPELI